jgi:hypothetical protein
MPVSYDTSGLLKCTVSMTYLRYVVAQTEQFSTEGKPEKPTSSETPNSTTDRIQNLRDNTDSEGNYKSKVTDPTLNEIKKYTTEKDPYYNPKKTGANAERAKYM